MQTINSLKVGDRFRLCNPATAYVSEGVYVVGSWKGCIAICHKIPDTHVTLHLHQDERVLKTNPI